MYSEEQKHEGYWLATVNNAAQVCPKCNGQGHVFTPPWVAGDATEYSTSKFETFECPVCEGRKVIYPSVPPTSQKGIEERAVQFAQLIRLAIIDAFHRYQQASVRETITGRTINRYANIATPMITKILAGSPTISDGWLPIETAPALLLENEKLKEQKTVLLNQLFNASNDIEKLKEEVNRLKEKYEPGECEKSCGMNYCDENGCTNRIRNYVDKEPIKPQS